MRTERLARPEPGPATVAFVGLLAFLFIVYANPGNWFDGLDDIPFAKIAAGFSLAALGGSWLLYNRRLTIGGVQGWALIGLFALVGFSSTWSYWPKFTFDTFTDGLKYLAIFFVIANVVDSEARLATTHPRPGARLVHPRVRRHLVARARRAPRRGRSRRLARHLRQPQRPRLPPRRRRRHALRRGQRRAHARAQARVVGAPGRPCSTRILLTQSRGGMLAACVVTLFWALRSVKRAPLILGAAVHRRRRRVRLAQQPVVAAHAGGDGLRRGRVGARPHRRLAHRRQHRQGAAADRRRRRRLHDRVARVRARRRRRRAHAAQHVHPAPVGARHPRAPALRHRASSAACSACGARARSPRRCSRTRAASSAAWSASSCRSIWGGIAWTWPLYVLLALAFAARRISYAPGFAPARAGDDTVVSPMPQPVPALVGR